MSSRQKILVLYDSFTGNVKEMAEEIKRGVEGVKDVEVILKKANKADVEDLKEYAGFAFGSPEHFKYMSGELKAFFDRTFFPSKKITNSIKGKPFFVFTSTAHSGKFALQSIEEIGEMFGFEKIAEGVVATQKPTAEVKIRLRELGEKLARICKGGKE